MPGKPITLSLEQRFLTHFAVTDDCWLWGGSKTTLGYGLIRKGPESRATVYAHRVAWWLATGHWPIRDEYVCHDCPNGDNPSCVRYDIPGVKVVAGIEYEKRGHLWLGDKVSNMMDMIAKGRMKYLEIPPERVLRGEAHPAAKLTQAQVEAIRGACQWGGACHRVIGEHYGISPSLVSMIRHGKRWAVPTV